MVNDMAICSAPSPSTISCSLPRTSEQAPTQRASSGSMPLVGSDGGDEAFGSPSRFRDGVDHLFVAARSPAGCDVRETHPDAQGLKNDRGAPRTRGGQRHAQTRRLVDARSSVVESLPPAGRDRPVGGQPRADNAGSSESL